MKVYVIECYEWYEGGSIIRFFIDETKAKKEVKNITSSKEWERLDYDERSYYGKLLQQWDNADNQKSLVLSLVDIEK